MNYWHVEQYDYILCWCFEQEPKNNGVCFLPPRKQKNLQTFGRTKIFRVPISHIVRYNITNQEREKNMCVYV